MHELRVEHQIQSTDLVLRFEVRLIKNVILTSLQVVQPKRNHWLFSDETVLIGDDLCTANLALLSDDQLKFGVLQVLLGELLLGILLIWPKV